MRGRERERERERDFVNFIFPGEIFPYPKSGPLFSEDSQFRQSRATHLSDPGQEWNCVFCVYERAHAFSLCACMLAYFYSYVRWWWCWLFFVCLLLFFNM